MKVVRAALVVGFVILVGCSVRPMPPMPSVKTPTGRNCVRDCQREHRLCNRGCQGMLLKESRCLSQCNQRLDECYRLCLDTS